MGRDALRNLLARLVADHYIGPTVRYTAAALDPVAERPPGLSPAGALCDDTNARPRHGAHGTGAGIGHGRGGTRTRSRAAGAAERARRRAGRAGDRPHPAAD